MQLIVANKVGPTDLILVVFVNRVCMFFLLQSRLVLQSITLTMRPSFQNVNSEHLYAKMSLGMPVVCAVSVLGRVVWSCSMSVLMVRLVPCILQCVFAQYVYFQCVCANGAYSGVYLSQVCLASTPSPSVVQDLGHIPQKTWTWETPWSQMLNSESNKSKYDETNIPCLVLVYCVGMPSKGSTR